MPSVNLGVCLLAVSNLLVSTAADADGLRADATRLRHPDHSTFQSSSLMDMVPDYVKFFKSVAQDPFATAQDTQAAADQHTDELDAIMKKVGDMLLMSMSDAPSTSPTILPVTGPSTVPVAVSIPSPTTTAPTESTATAIPTTSPIAAPTPSPSSIPTTPQPTDSPTVAGCGISLQDRIDGILAMLDAVADPDKIRDNAFPQGLATTWLIEDDGFFVCPDDPNLIQRWALAVIYFSTAGDDWFLCSDNPTSLDLCGAEDPFVGETRFLSADGECDWAGISCTNNIVTEIVFEENNLVGTIPTELGLLSNLAVWGMERGGLTGTIPTQVGLLTNLIFIDLDFNALTGSLSSELLSLTALTQLDLNNNQLTGSINGIGVFPDLTFLQIHSNLFTGTVPESLGDSSNLGAFTLHQTSVGGTMPQSVCNLLVSNGGVLTSLIADCSLPTPDIVCNCCTDCRDT